MDRTPPDARELLRVAIASTDKGDLDAAVADLTSLIAIDSQHEIANGMLAAIYAERKLPQLATDYYRRVLAINPQNALARFQLGLMQLQASEPEQALDTWRELLQIPDDFLVHFHSAVALLLLNRTDEARPLLETAAARMPQDHVLYPSLQDLLPTL